MRPFFMIGVVIVLSACASSHQITPLETVATIDIIERRLVESQFRGGGRNVQIEVEFDYKIENFEPGKAYHCHLIFDLGDDGKQKMNVGNDTRYCRILNEEGTLIRRWTTPLDPTAKFTKGVLNKIKIPIKFHIVMAKKIGRDGGISIGISEPMSISKVEVLDILGKIRTAKKSSTN